MKKSIRLFCRLAACVLLLVLCGAWGPPTAKHPCTTNKYGELWVEVSNSAAFDVYIMGEVRYAWNSSHPVSDALNNAWGNPTSMLKLTSGQRGRWKTTWRSDPGCAQSVCIRAVSEDAKDKLSSTGGSYACHSSSFIAALATSYSDQKTSYSLTEANFGILRSSNSYGVTVEKGFVREEPIR